MLRLSDDSKYRIILISSAEKIIKIVLCMSGRRWLEEVVGVQETSNTFTRSLSEIQAPGFWGSLSVHLHHSACQNVEDDCPLAIHLRPTDIRRFVDGTSPLYSEIDQCCSIVVPVGLERDWTVHLCMH